MKRRVLIRQLTAYEKRRLNKQRKCVICDKNIYDYDIIAYDKRRHQRVVEYAFAHDICVEMTETNNLFSEKEIIALYEHLLKDC